VPINVVKQKLLCVPYQDHVMYVDTDLRVTSAKLRDGFVRFEPLSNYRMGISETCQHR
jgi:hypothetical protein